MPVAGGHLMVPAGFLRALIAQKRLMYFSNLFGVPMDVDVDVVSSLSNLLSKLDLCEAMDVDDLSVPMDVDDLSVPMDVDVDVVSSLSDFLSKLDLYEAMDVN